MVNDRQVRTVAKTLEGWRKPRYNPLLGTYFTMLGTGTALIGLLVLFVYGTVKGGRLTSSTDVFLFGFLFVGLLDTAACTIRMRRKRRSARKRT